MSIIFLFVFSFTLFANEAGATNSTSGFGNDLPDTDDLTEISQQQVTVVGRVSDESGIALPGVNVTVKGTVIGVMTNMDGDYSITVPSRDAILQYSSIGYDMQEVTVGNQSTINITLVENVQMLEEVVVVGYGTQKKETLTGAISQISSEDIVSTKQADAVASLQGKIPGLLIRQNSTKPGGFASELSLRGYGAPMIVVDGVVRSGAVYKKNSNPWSGSATETSNDMSALQEINPDDIESISVLKDAAAAIYGLGAANGVILITTKKGKEGAPTITYSNQFVFSRPATIRRTEDWISFMEWDNAMADVAKMGHRFTDELIEKYRNNDPSVYHTDWYDLLTKDYASTMTHNLSLRGGSDRVSYYFGTGYSDDKTIFVTDGYKYNRFTINGNVTAKLTDDLTLRYQTSMRFTEKSEPGSGDVEWNLLYYIHATNPMVTPQVIGNPDHYSNVEEQMNPMALLDTDLLNSNTFDKSYQNTVDLTYKAPFLEGLQIVATGAYDYSTSNNRTLIRKFDLYDYQTDVYAASFRESTNYRELWINNSRLYGRMQANYAKKIDKHDINATLAWEATVNKSANLFGRRLYGATDANSFFTHDVIDQGLASTATNSGSRNSTATQGVLGRVSYSYAGKYLFEATGRYDGTYFYAPGKRWGFFPSYSVGWRISEEAFIKDNLPWINNLKIRWSDGFTGSTQGSAYAYIGGYSQSGSWIFSEGATVNGWNSTTVENTILTWADVRMMDIGVDFDLWRSKFGGSFDWFKRRTSGISATRTASLPDFYGVSLPSENLNVSENVGLELSLSYRDNIGDFNFRVSTSGTFSRFRYTYLERARTDTYASSMAYWSSSNIEGRWSNARSATTWDWADGSQFQSLGEISEENVIYNTSSANQTVVPGMYRLEDRDGNGYINNDDRFYKWSQSNPPLQYGLNISGDYKDFDFSVVFSGGALHSKTLGLSSYAGFGYLYYLPKQYTEDCWKVAEYGDDPWDPNTEWESGFWPALARVNRAGSSHNATYTNNQPYNFINAAYLRLKTVELGYTFKPALLNKVGIKSARLYVNGGNLYTFCNKLLKNIDPESNDNGRQGGYFQPTKTFSFGVNLNF